MDSPSLQNRMHLLNTYHFRVPGLFIVLRRRLGEGTEMGGGGEGRGEREGLGFVKQCCNQFSTLSGVVGN